MAIPNQILANTVSGIPGEYAFHGPNRALSAVLDSTMDSINVFGRAFTYFNNDTETVRAGGVEGGTFAGIMVNPKAYALDFNYALNGTVGEFCFMGEVYVELSTTGGVIGDPIWFDNMTGALGHGTPTGLQTAIENCFISRHNVSPENPTLAVIKLTQ